MTWVNPVELARISRNAGWSGNDTYTAVAVALAHSAGYSTRTYGLWGLVGQDAAADPATQATNAHAAQAAGGWAAFDAYRSGIYKLQMPSAVLAVGQLATNSVVANPGAFVAGVTAGASSTLQEAAQNLGGSDFLALAKDAIAPLYKAGAWLSNQANWLRIAYVVFGGAVIVGALVTIAGPSAVGQIAGAVAKPVAKTLTSKGK